MNPKEWQDMLDDALDGILICTPEEKIVAREKVYALRQELLSAYSYRTEFEKKIESTIEADPILQKAIDEYLGGQVGAAVATALHVQAKAKRILGEENED